VLIEIKPAQALSRLDLECETLVAPIAADQARGDVTGSDVRGEDLAQRGTPRGAEDAAVGVIGKGQLAVGGATPNDILLGFQQVAIADFAFANFPLDVFDLFKDMFGAVTQAHARCQVALRPWVTMVPYPARNRLALHADGCWPAAPERAASVGGWLHAGLGFLLTPIVGSQTTMSALTRPYVGDWVKARDCPETTRLVSGAHEA
jgi:hypothetical protein